MVHNHTVLAGCCHKLTLPSKSVLSAVTLPKVRPLPWRLSLTSSRSTRLLVGIFQADVSTVMGMVLEDSLTLKRKYFLETAS